LLYTKFNHAVFNFLLWIYQHDMLPTSEVE